jgi:hypothetical protein
VLAALVAGVAAWSVGLGQSFVAAAFRLPGAATLVDPSSGASAPPGRR